MSPNPIHIRFTEDVSVMYSHTTDCFSGFGTVTPREYVRGSDLMVSCIERGSKRKGGRVSTVYIDIGTQQEDHFLVKESKFKVVEPSEASNV